MSLYEFTDTTQASPAIGKAAEAVCFNGVWLDDEIAGFRTLNVSGREVADKDIDTKDTKEEFGETFLRASYPPRTITVTYQLIAKTNALFREYYNKLNKLLSPKQAKLIFADEPDKYYIATKSGNDEVDEGLNSVTGYIKFYCSDPCKYSTTQKTFTAIDGVITVANAGDVAVPIDYSVTMNSDNGYIGIVSDEGVMQYGKVDEADGTTYTDSETLATLTNLINAADDHSAEVTHPYSEQGTAGTLGTKTWWNNTFLTLATTGGDTKNWNGGMKTLTLPADSQGVTGAKNFYSYFHLVFYAGLMGQTGQMALSFLTSDNKPICGVNWWKTDKNGNTGNYEIWAYNSKKAATSTNSQYIGILKNWTFQCNHLQAENPWFWDWGHCDLKKSGSKVTYFYGGKYYTYDLPEIKDMECAKVQFSVKFAKGRTGNKALSNLGLNVFTFRKDNVEKWKDVPNRYADGDVVEIKGQEGKIYVNGMAKMGDEVTGTSYFKAKPGTNTIEVHNSDWAEDVTATATIREAWL